MASEARAASMTLTVLSGSTTIYTVTGGSVKVTANVGALNADLTAAGLGGYSFSSLGGSSNNPGNSGPVGGYIITTGTLDVASGGSGAGSPLTIVVTEGGFTAPTSGMTNTLKDEATANYVGVTSTSSQASTGMFMDSSAVTATIGPLTQTPSSPAGVTGMAPVASYVTPYTLMSTQVLSLTAASSLSPGSDGFSNKVIITASSIPEPASLVMMLTGMPLPLVVLGLLRRRRAAA